MKIFLAFIVGLVVTMLIIMVFVRDGRDIEPKKDEVKVTMPKNDNVRVTTPLPGSVVESPLTVTGEARGTWYFEASFLVTVRDANNQVLGTSVAQAQGEWMTTEFVPFQTMINFSTPSTPIGFLVFRKDNPSGLPENDAEVLIPIRF